MALYQRLWGPGCGMFHRSGSLLRPRQSVAPCQAAGGRRMKASDPEPEPEPESKAEAPPPRRGRPRKTTTGAGAAEAAAAPPSPPPPPPGGPEEDAPVAAPTAAKRGRKTRASAAAPPTRPAAGPDLSASEPAPAAAADVPAADAPRRGRGRKASTAAAAAPAAAAAAPAAPSSSSSDAGAVSAPAPASTAPSSTGAPGSSLLDPMAFGGSPPSDNVFFFEGGNVTASQELDAMEDDVPSRLHLGFGDPMHSTDDLTFHHEQELLPARAARGAGAGGGGGGGMGAAAVATEEDGWAKWRKFKAGTLPPEEMEYYRSLQEIDAQTYLPDWLRPDNAQELAQMRENMDMLMRMVREWEQDAFQDQAYAIHHYQNEKGVNRYMNARQLAGYLAQVELEDHQSPDRERMRFSSYARAEHRFAADFDAFNAHLEDHMQDYVIKLPPGAEDAEDVDVLDDVLLLSDGARSDGLPGTGDTGDTADDAATGGTSGVDRWLSGVLPGGAEGSADAALVEDLLAEDAEDDLEAAAG